MTIGWPQWLVVQFCMFMGGATENNATLMVGVINISRGPNMGSGVTCFELVWM
jgi:hypothetical protein